MNDLKLNEKYCNHTLEIYSNIIKYLILEYNIYIKHPILI